MIFIFIGSTVEQREGITFVPVTIREAFDILIIPWGSGLNYVLSTYRLIVIHGD